MILWQGFNYVATLNRKNPVNQTQGWEPIHEKYKANLNTNRHNSKKKTKARNQQKSDKDLMQIELMTTK
jgi:hypothetical protein